MNVIKRIKGLGLTAKYNVLSIMLVLITAIAVTTYAVKREWDNHIQTLMEDGRHTAQILAAFSEYAIYTEDAESINTILNSRDDSLVTYLGLLRQDTSVLAEKWNEPANEIFPDWRKNSTVYDHDGVFSDDGRYIQFIVPVLGASNSALDAFVADDDTVTQHSATISK